MPLQDGLIVNARRLTDPPYFAHKAVLTLFHEFGRALQHMLTKMDYADISGTNGIP